MIWKSKFSATNYVRGTLVVPSKDLTAGAAERIARQAFEENSNKQLVHVEIFCEEDYPPFHSFLLSHVGYDWWKHGFENVPRFPMARLVAIEGNAVFEYGDGEHIQRKVLAGSDPLLVTVGASTFRVLYFAFVPITVRRPQELDADRLKIFAETDQALDPIAGKDLFAALNRLIPLTDISLFIRNDTWFLDIAGYPLIYPFRHEETPPTKEIFQKSHTLLCGGPTKDSYHCIELTGH